MNEEAHPSLDVLKQYTHHPESDAMADIGLHLATCQECRTVIQGIQLLSGAVCNSRETIDDELQNELMDYMDRRLPASRQKDLLDRLQTDNAAIRQALHYACSSAAMERQLSTARKAVSEVKKNRRLFSFLQFRMPAWIMFPTAVAASLLIIWLLVPLLQTDDYQLVAYQDDPRLEIQAGNTLPGMGFFHGAKKQQRLYDQVKPRLLSNHEIRIDWPAIDNARSYDIRLDVFDNGQRRSLGKVSTIHPWAVFDTRGMDLKRRYEWTLSGETASAQLFRAQGGFIIH